MEVTEFERDAAFGVVIRDGPMEIPGRATFESLGPQLTVAAEFPLDGSIRWLDAGCPNDSHEA